MSQTFNHRQRMERLAVARRFAVDERMEAMLTQAADDPDFKKGLRPTERVNLSRYAQNKETAAEVEQDLKRMGSRYYDLHE